MFSRNGLISEKQMRRMLILYVFSGGIFVLPYLFSLMFGRDIIIGIILFIVIAGLYCLLVVSLSKGAAAYPRSKTITLIQVMRYIIRLVFYIILTVAILGEGQVPFVSKNSGNSIVNLMVLMPLLLVALYGANHNLEKQGRLSEMIMPAVVFPYIILIILGINEMNTLGNLNILSPDMSIGKMLICCYGLLTFVIPVEIYPQLKSNLGEEKGTHYKSYFSILLVLILMGLISVLMAGIYGVNGMKGEPMATISIMRYIELPLGVLQRFDVLMIWFFMTGCFALICGTLFFVRKQLREFIPEKNVWAVLSFILIAAVIIAYMCPEYPDMLRAFLVYGALIDVPLSVILLAARKTGSRLNKKMAALLIITVCGTLFTGCSENVENIEQRDYATVLMVAPGKADVTDDGEMGKYHFTIGIAKEHRNGEENEAETIFQTYGNGFEELSKNYGDRRGKELSLSHLKVILIAPVGSADFPGEDVDNEPVQESEEVLPDSHMDLAEVTGRLDEQEEVAKTCPMLFVPDEEGVADYLCEADEPMGNYIAGLVRTSEKNGGKVPKLMDYLKAIRDEMKVDIAFLEKRDGDMAITGIESGKQGNTFIKDKFGRKD